MKLPIAALALCGIGLSPISQALQLDYRLKGTVAGVGDSGRDLDLEAQDGNRQAYLDLTPWVHLRMSDDWAAFVRVRAFATSDEVLTSGNDNNNITSGDESHLALKEAWIEYGGLTSYPGEVLRIGRQRLRQDDAQWWDQDIDAVRWIFDTTLLKAELAVARQFDSYRSDGTDPALEQQDRTYVLGAIATDWRPRHRIGLRAAHARDDNDLPPEGGTVDGDKLERASLSWVGVTLDNYAQDWRQPQPFSYWASANWVTGHQQRSTLSAPDTAGPRVRDDVDAWAADAGLRWQPSPNVPLQLGLAYSWSAGDAEDGGGQYRPTGLQSNYSRFTGTRSLVHRYNEAFRAEEGNLRVATAFVSTSAGGWDASLVFNDFRRDEGGAPIFSDGLLVAPVNADEDIGRGYDLVISRYFAFGRERELPGYVPGETGDSVVRLRGSLFEPGEAYGPDAGNESRVILELTLWY